MDTEQGIALLGGLSPAQFMRRHWQKRPLLVRGAFAGGLNALGRRELFGLAGRDDVESRLIVAHDGDWRLRRGPFGARAFPPLRQNGWTLLVQGADLQVPAARAVLDQFRFVPEARLDDLMVSFATDGGGVGPHFDSYDVFLIQAQGRRRWQWGAQPGLDLVDGLPLKILRQFEPSDEAVLEPGDLLYLPPRYAHDGVAQGPCMTWSVGFRAPSRGALAAELLQRLAQEAADADDTSRYRDPHQAAVNEPGKVPQALADFARAALERVLAQPGAIERALGEVLTEPKPNVWFEGEAAGAVRRDGVWLDARTRMLFDRAHVYINGESYRAAGRDARLMRQLANERSLARRELAQVSASALALLQEWNDAGWIHGLG